MTAVDVTPQGPSWDDVRKELFTPEEIQASDRRVAEIGREINRNGLVEPCSPH